VRIPQHYFEKSRRNIVAQTTPAAIVVTRLLSAAVKSTAGIDSKGFSKYLKEPPIHAG